MFTEVLFASFRVNVRESVPLDVMVPLDSVTPPESEPDSRTWNLEAICFEESSGSLNVTFSTPLPVLYTADVKLGRMVSFIVMVWFAAAAIALPAVSLTAPASMYRRGVGVELTEALAVEFRVRVREVVPLDVMVPLDSVIPPELCVRFLMWNLEATCFEESSGSLNDTVRAPLPVLYAADEKVGRRVSRTDMSLPA